jgi:hypothetical protein
MKTHSVRRVLFGCSLAASLVMSFAPSIATAQIGKDWQL